MAKNGKKRPATAPAGEKPKACYVLSLSVENVRCFGPKQTLDLSDGHGRPAPWTIILGENGTGKTTLLQLLVGFEGIPAERAKQIRYPNGTFVSAPRQAGLDQQKLTDSLLRRTDSNDARAVFDLHYLATAGFGSYAFEQKLAARTIITERAREFGYVDNLLVFVGYGTTRRLGGSIISEAAEDNPVGTLFSDTASLRNASEWLIRLDYGTNRKDPGWEQHRDRLRQVTELLTSGILPGITDVRFIVEGDVYPTAVVEFLTPYGWVPLRQLGYGYQTLIAWMLDFVSRMVERYPNSPEPLKESAICVVDEIDLHLHPKWQRDLVGFLSERFPNTQFIATAHSPLVVQAAENANIAVVRKVEGKDYVEILNDVDDIRNWRVDQILTSDLFGLDSARSPEVEKLFKRQEQLAVKARPTRAEKQEFKDIQAKIEQLPTWAGLDERRELETIRTILERLDRTSPK